MKRFLVMSFAVAALALTTDAFAGPKALSDGELEGVVAGSAIIGNGAEAAVSEHGAVDLSDSALSEAAALNVSNSAESLMANGVNILGSSYIFQQTNQISQDSAAYAGNITHVEASSEWSASNSDVMHSAAGVDPASLNITINGLSYEDGISFSLDSASLDANYGRGAAAAGDGTDTVFAEIYNVGNATAERGSACVTAVGASCSASMNQDTEYHEEQSTSTTTSSLTDVVAAYITGDDSYLDVSSEDTVALSGDSLSGATALNISNASSSSVANGVNIAFGAMVNDGVTASLENNVNSVPYQSNCLNQYR